MATIATIATYRIQRLPIGASPAPRRDHRLARWPPASGGAGARRVENRAKKSSADLGRRTIDQPRADLRELAADLRFHDVGEQRVPALGGRQRDLGLAVGKSRGAALPREMQRVAGGRRRVGHAHRPGEFRRDRADLGGKRRAPFVVADALERFASGNGCLQYRRIVECRPHRWRAAPGPPGCWSFPRFAAAKWRVAAYDTRSGRTGAEPMLTVRPIARGCARACCRWPRPRHRA